MKIIDTAYYAAARRCTKINGIYEHLADAVDLNEEDTSHAERENRQLLAEHDALMAHIRKSQKELKALAKERRTIVLAGRIYAAEEVVLDTFCNTVDAASRLRRAVRRTLRKGGRA